MPGLVDVKIPFGQGELMPRLLDKMPRFENMRHRRLLRVLHYLIPCHEEKARRARDNDPNWIEREESRTASWFENCVYTLDVIITKHVNMAWPKPDPSHKSEVRVMDNHLLPESQEFLARVYYLRLTVTIDLYGLSNDAKIDQIKQQLDQFTSLKKADVTIRVRSIDQAMRDNTWFEVTLFLYMYREERGCEMNLRWIASEDAYFPTTEKEKMTIDCATDPRLGLTTPEDQHGAFKASFFGRVFHG